MAVDTAGATAACALTGKVASIPAASAATAPRDRTGRRRPVFVTREAGKSAGPGEGRRTGSLLGGSILRMAMLLELGEPLVRPPAHSGPEARSVAHAT